MSRYLLKSLKRCSVKICSSPLPRGLDVQEDGLLQEAIFVVLPDVLQDLERISLASSGDTTSNVYLCKLYKLCMYVVHIHIYIYIHTHVCVALYRSYLATI